MRDVPKKFGSFMVAAMFMTIGLAGISLASDDSDAYDYTLSSTIFVGESSTVNVAKYYGYGSSYVWPGTINVTSNVPGMTLKYDTMKLSGNSPSGGYVSNADHWMNLRLEGTPATKGTYTFKMSCTEMAGESGWRTSTWTITVKVVDPIYVSFDSQGGSESPSTQKSTSFRLPSPGTKVDNEFLGWYTAPVGGTFVGNANAWYAPTESCTLYGKKERDGKADMAATVVTWVEKSQMYESDQYHMVQSMVQQ